jgi:4-carboxymuconolactone decarboxylase
MSILPVPTFASGPRIRPITRPEWSDKVREYFGLAEGVGTEGGEPTLNVAKTLARHPDLALAYRPFGKHILLENTLSARQKELVTQRTALRCGSAYEWIKHKELARSYGFGEEEIDAIRIGADAPCWSAMDRALLESADQLIDKTDIDDATWEKLARHFDQQQLLDLIFTVGSYVMLAMVLNAARVQLED